MAFANVFLGNVPGDGTGDSLRAAFNTINQNFANLAAINGNANVVVYATGNARVTATYNPGVESIIGAGGLKRGNVQLTYFMWWVLPALVTSTAPLQPRWAMLDRET